MRVLICYEGKPSISGQYLEPGCLVWDEKPYPIMWGPLDRLMGMASDIRREDDGTITAEVDEASLSEDARSVFSDVGTTIWCNETTEAQVDGVRHIKSARIKALFFSPSPGGVPWHNPPLEKETD